MGIPHSVERPMARLELAVPIGFVSAPSLVWRRHWL